MDQDIKDIFILVNGPGELASYVKPTLEALKKRQEIKKRITIIFTPCPYASGNEEMIAKNLPEVTQVINVNAFIKWMLFGNKPKIEFGKHGLVVFMGGDIIYGKMLAKRLHYPAIAYTESYAKWPKIYKKFLVPDDQIYNKLIEQKFPKEKIEIIGNLMVDSIKLDKNKQQIFNENDLDLSSKLISFLPGSRYFQVQFTIPFFAKTAKEISKMNNNVQFAFILSPYLPKHVFEKQLINNGFSLINGYIKYKDIPIKIIESSQHDAIAASDLIITIPGTNTAEVTIIGTSMIVVFPNNTAHMIPLEGIYEIIGNIPLLGFLFKKMYVNILLRVIRYFAIPNIKAGKEIVPEMKGNVVPEDIAKKVKHLLDNPELLINMKNKLSSLLGKPGAAIKLSEEIINEIIH